MDENIIKREPLTPIQLKGVGMCMNSLKRKYPFISGWRLISDYLNYKGVIFVRPIVDLHKLSEFVGCPVKSWWFDEDGNLSGHHSEKDFRFFNLSLAFELECLGEDKERMLDEEIPQKMEELLDHSYREILPDEMVVITGRESEHFPGRMYYSRDTIRLSMYSLT